MRQRANWMNPVDDRILELLADEGAGTPKSLADSIGHNNDYVGVRCRELAAFGLLRRPSRGLYLLSEQGQAYLEGELDAGDLEKDGDADQVDTRGGGRADRSARASDDADSGRRSGDGRTGRSDEGPIGGKRDGQATEDRPN